MTILAGSPTIVNVSVELRQAVNVIDFKHISDTNKLYNSDDTFKKLVKAKKEATKQCELYINKHN